VLFDLGAVSTPEPFFKLVNQGLILGEDGQKMSKSRGNVINPDVVVAEYGADAFRLYEMFMGPLEMVKPWSTQGVEGVYKFLGRVWRLFIDDASEQSFEQAQTTASGPNPGLLEELRLKANIQAVEPSPTQLKTLHACIKKVTEDLDGMRFNTAISALMVFINEATGWEVKPVRVLGDFLILLQPFAPHLAEELHQKLAGQGAGGGKESLPHKHNGPDGAGQAAGGADGAVNGAADLLAYVAWPQYDPALLVETVLELPVQVNGKLRDVIRVAANATQAEVEQAALASAKVQAFVAGKTVKKIIVVPKKVVNIAVA
jgi:leucyl-tRNA synthetase